MKKIFLDANILVAVLNKEYPLFPDAAKILSLSNNQNIQVFTSPICLAIAYYFAEKKSGCVLAKKKIELLLDHIFITTVDQNVVCQTLQNSKIHDVEDGMEYYSAIESGCSFIITEDRDDFYFSEIVVFNCKSFLSDYL